jgi:hypothetical protein
LNEVVMLKLVNRLERPIVPRQVKIGIDIRAVLPTGGECLDDPVENILLVKQLVIRAELHVVGILGRIGNLKGPVAVGQLPYVEPNVCCAAEVTHAIVRQFPARAPAERVGITDGNVKRLFFRPGSPRLVLIRMLS